MPLLRLIDPSLATRLSIIAVMDFVHTIVIAFFIIKYFSMIINKNARFFRYFEIATIINICTNLANIIIQPGFNPPSIVRNMLAFTIGAALWFTYFSKSVRVRTYFGSDEYLRRSIFLKKLPSPEPADTRPYTHT